MNRLVAGFGRPLPKRFAGGISTRWRLCLAIALVAVLSAGSCGRRGPAVEMVKGRVLLDGEPLGGASVGFLPAAPGKGVHAFGLTKPDGSFRLTTLPGGAAQAGTATGDYQIVISKIVRVDPNGPPPSVKSRPGASYPKLERVGAWQPDSLIIVPEDYGMAATSGLTATVKRGVNEFTFELRSNYEKPAAKSGT